MRLGKEKDCAVEQLEEELYVILENLQGLKDRSLSQFHNDLFRGILISFDAVDKLLTEIDPSNR